MRNDEAQSFHAQQNGVKVFDGNDDESGSSEESDQYDEFFGAGSAPGPKTTQPVDIKVDENEKDVDISAMGGFIPEEDDPSAFGGFIPSQEEEATSPAKKKPKFTSVQIDDDFQDVSASASASAVTKNVTDSKTTPANATGDTAAKGSTQEDGKKVPQIRQVLQDLVAPKQDFEVRDEFASAGALQAIASDSKIKVEAAQDEGQEEDEIDEFGVSREEPLNLRFNVGQALRHARRGGRGEERRAAGERRRRGVRRRRVERREGLEEAGLARVSRPAVEGVELALGRARRGGVVDAHRAHTVIGYG